MSTKTIDLVFIFNQSKQAKQVEEAEYASAMSTLA